MANPTVEVLVTVPLGEILLGRLREVSARLHITSSPARKAEEISDEVWARTEVLYTDLVLPEAAKAPNLRWIQFHFAGIDAAVESPLLKNSTLVATTLSGAAASQMAEYAVMMMLALGHHIPDMVGLQARAEWPRDRFERLSPRELRGSTVGIVGYGSIGRQIAHVLQPFGASVLAAKRDVMHPEDNGYRVEELGGDPGGDLFQRLYPIEALSSMLKLCDFVAVTIPLTPETHNLIGGEELSVMKPTAYLVDLSRGGIVDQSALIQALQEKHLAGAALDVFSEEPLPSNSPLWKMGNVLISPHISGTSPQYNERATSLFVDNLNRYLTGLPLYNRYDPQKGY
ncbi:MAG: D-2-hydroxyacid dehydrogenase [Anaerolineaceae bacterium]|nr:D-2-hydroxyacid dehydrogenase [Anaerolineaceae bacterium]